MTDWSELANAYRKNTSPQRQFGLLSRLEPTFGSRDLHSDDLTKFASSTLQGMPIVRRPLNAIGVALLPLSRPEKLREAAVPRSCFRSASAVPPLTGVSMMPPWSSSTNPTMPQPSAMQKCGDTMARSADFHPFKAKG
jgi:hypothetical protein